jgi:hypothetical protein
MINAANLIGLEPVRKGQENTWNIKNTWGRTVKKVRVAFQDQTACQHGWAVQRSRPLAVSALLVSSCSCQPIGHMVCAWILHHKSGGGFWPPCKTDMPDIAPPQIAGSCILEAKEPWWTGGLAGSNPLATIDNTSVCSLLCTATSMSVRGCRPWTAPGCRSSPMQFRPGSSLSSVRVLRVTMASTSITECTGTHRPYGHSSNQHLEHRSSSLTWIRSFPGSRVKTRAFRGTKERGTLPGNKLWWHPWRHSGD